MEIVEDNVSGLLFSSRSQLARQTLKLISDHRNGCGAWVQRPASAEKSSAAKSLQSRVREIFAKMLDEYRLDQ